VSSRQERRRLLLVIAIVVLPLVVYPLVSVVDGAPRFPTRGECAHAARPGDSELEVVYGRLDDPVAAEELRARVLKLGFIGTELAFDACGRWKVSYDAIDSFDQGQALAEEARRVGLDPRVESGD
jgi:hypothetical protein